MPAPIGLQLYSVRDALSTDFEGTVRKIADFGYVGVETAKQYGSGPQQAAALFKSLGLTVCSAHLPMPLGDSQQETLDTMATFSCTNLVIPWLPSERFVSADLIKAVCDELNQADAVARQHGMTLFYHNHWWEFTPLAAIGGRTPFDLMLDLLAPTVHLEVDLYWAKAGGSDPVATLKRLGKRANLLHVKDGPAVIDQPMTAVGDGTLDYTDILSASNSDWLIVELDRCATDMLEAVGKSCRYLTGKGLAHGKR